MKYQLVKYLKSIITIVATIILISCSPEELETEPLNAYEMIVGSWKATAQEEYIDKEKTLTIVNLSNECRSKDRLNFYKASKYNSKFWPNSLNRKYMNISHITDADGLCHTVKDIGTYLIEGDNLIYNDTREIYTYKFKLTPNTFSITTTGNNGYEVTTYYIKT